MDGRMPDALVITRLRTESATIDPAPVLAALCRSMELWRFDQKRQAAEPEPAEWAGLVAAIAVDSPVTHEGALLLTRRIGALPAQVLAWIDTALFEDRRIGRVQLIARLTESPNDQDAQVLRDALERVRVFLENVRGKRGPRHAVGPHLRRVVALLVEQGIPSVRARVLAADLLRLCGIPAPEGRSQLAALVRE